MRKAASDVFTVIGTRAAGEAFRAVLAAKRGGAGEFIDADKASLPDLFAYIARRPSFDLYIQQTSSSEFPYFCGERVRHNGDCFIRLRYKALSPFAAFLKRVFDIVFCSLALLLLSPLLLLSAVLVKCSSRGPVFYSQTRIGKNGKPFEIYKFRSMRVDAETSGPCLSKKGDMRITPWGQIMRKFRIDELPQLWMVLKGDMALVGYRPERDFYIRQIVETSPYYTLLYAVKPGITSAGITTFGYAENVEEMLVRLEKDMDYLTHLSLKEDLRVVGKTVKVVLFGVGK